MPVAKRGGGDVDRVVAEQQRAEQPLALLEQAVDDAGALVSLLLQPRHAGARGGGERRLAAGEERRQQQADQHDSEREPVVLWLIGSAKLIGQKGAHLGRARRRFRRRPAPMPRTRMKVSLPRFTFLSCAIRSINASSARHAAGDILEMGGQPDRRKMRAHPRGLGLADQALGGRRTRTPAPCRAPPPRRAAGGRRSRRRLPARGRRCGRD